MARRFKTNRNNRKVKSTPRKKNSYSKEITKFAKMMGAVERGRKNSDSLISQAYERGATEPAKREKKSLF